VKVLMVIGALACSLASALGQGAADQDPRVTAVTGESWLNHLHRPFSETSMGRSSWRLGPSALQTGSFTPHPSTAFVSQANPLNLHGADLYRLNCQGCHGELGQGAPPEIASLINPVRASSAALVQERMKALGMDLSRRESAEMANQASAALLQRLHDGGQNMPSFRHLTQPEIRSLVAYLKQLAGVPGAEREQIAVPEAPARIGELIAKSTCHVCHDATGPYPTVEQLAEGGIPPLITLSERLSQTQLVRKVTAGAPILMGSPALVYRGRMPVFSYLSENEAADVYGYLNAYPPTQMAGVDQIAQNSPMNQQSDSPRPSPEPATLQALAPRESDESIVLPAGITLSAMALIGLGCGITVFEFHRHGAEHKARDTSTTAAESSPIPDSNMEALAEVRQPATQAKEAAAGRKA
jgi:mono/diheme cytochrome c family protein